MTDKQDDDIPEINVVIVETEYLCGARVGFAARNVEEAASAAARIMTDVCPECRQRMGEELSERDKRILRLAPKDGDERNN